MNGQVHDLPCVQFFYRDGVPLRMVTYREERWFSVRDVFRQMGNDTDESGAAALLEAMGMPCYSIPCVDGEKMLGLVCIREDGLMRLFDKMERFGA
jgi:hypothetical protein